MKEFCDGNRVAVPGDDLTWHQMLDRANARLDVSTGLADQRLVFVIDDVQTALATAVYALAHGLDAGVIEAGRVSDGVRERFAEHAITPIDLTAASHAQPAPCAAGGSAARPGRVTVFTSGTTGHLKLVEHTWTTLNTFDRVNNLPANHWFLPYQVGSYAWYQMVAMALFVPGQHLVAGDMKDLAASFASALERGAVTASSSTPTFWRQALMSIDRAQLASAQLDTISIGGEIVDQAILDELRSLYPTAKIRHIYASSEAGAAIVVTDGLAGFPRSVTERPQGPVSVRVDGDRLFVRSRYANSTDGDGWVDTGDLVELRGDRYFFCGRAGNTVINVGGHKAFAPDIEAHLMKHPDVIWAKVSAKRAPLVGNLPVADVVLKGAISPDEAERLLTSHCLEGLAEYAVPRMWKFLERVPMRASLKS